MQENVTGLKGVKVILTKTSLKKGCKSKALVGKTQKITLAQEIVTGYPIMKKRLSGYLSEKVRSCPATSTVISFLKDEMIVETETSFYKVEIIS